MAGPNKRASAASAIPAGLTAIDTLFEPFRRDDGPGLVVAVARGGKVLYRRGFGMASLELGVANTPATRLRIGSASKQFTCLAALLLAEDGKLDIDGPIGHYISELPPRQQRPSLRQLMSHTSGLHDYLDLAGIAAGVTVQPAGKALPTQVRQEEVNFDPGEGQIYCNGSFHLLSLAIERVSGVLFETFLQERIFRPLCLLDTASVPSDMTLTPGMATLHVPQPGSSGKSWRRGIFPTEEIRGEGAMVSTVDDMLKWLAHLRGPHVVGTDDTWRQMTTVATLGNGVKTAYGLGLWSYRYRGLDVLSHHGGVYGGACQLLTVPAHELDIVIMTNGLAASPVEQAKRIVDALLPDDVEGPAAPRLATTRRHRHLVGTRYHGPSGVVIGFDDVKGKLGLSIMTSPPAPILRDEGAVLRVGFEDLVMGELTVRTRDLAADVGGGAPMVIRWYENGYVERLARLPRRAPSVASAARDVVGRYRSDEMDADAWISFDGKTLSMRYEGGFGNQHQELRPLSREVYAVVVTDELDPMRYVMTVELRDTRVTGFRITLQRTRRLRFDRVDER